MNNKEQNMEQNLALLGKFRELVNDINRITAGTPQYIGEGKIGTNLLFKGHMFRNKTSDPYATFDLHEQLSKSSWNILGSVDFSFEYAQTEDGQPTNEIDKFNLTFRTPKCDSYTNQNKFGTTKDFYSAQGSNDMVQLVHLKSETDEDVKNVVDRLFSVMDRSKQKVAAPQVAKQDAGREM